MTKRKLAQWLTDQNNDCGKDTFFSEDPRGAMTVEEAHAKFMKWSKRDLVDAIFSFSKEGENFLLENNVIQEA